MTTIRQPPRVIGPALATLVWLLAIPAHAQVIEIGDDGASRVYSGPTQFVTEAPETAATTLAAPRVPSADPFERAGRA